MATSARQRSPRASSPRPRTGGSPGPSGRAGTVRIRGAHGALVIRGTDLRAAVGVGILRSTLFAVRVADGVWEEPIPVPGYGEWFGYVSGGWYYRGLFYFVHSTWIGGTASIDGQPHHFLGTLTVFDPRRRAFSRLDIPARSGEEFMCDYLLEVGGELFLLAANRNPPLNAVILRTSRPRP